MKTTKIVLGILAGVAAGAVMGILFAPNKGSRTRKRILRRGDDYADDIKDKFDEFVDNISDKYRGAKENAEDVFAKGKTKYSELKKEVKNGAI